jgi:hypothetical protein
MGLDRPAPIQHRTGLHVRLGLSVLGECIENALIDDVQEIVTPMNCGWGKPERSCIEPLRLLDRFQNSRALLMSVKGAIFLMKNGTLRQWLRGTSILEPV